MAKSTVRDDIRSKAKARIEELEPLVEEYEEMRRISARAEEARKLIAAEPGISVGALAERMGIGTTYLYRLLPRLEREGLLRKEGRGYHPA